MLCLLLKRHLNSVVKINLDWLENSKHCAAAVFVSAAKESLFVVHWSLMLSVIAQNSNKKWLQII